MDWVDVTERGLLGVEAIAVDPQESNTVYMMTGTSYWNSGRSAFLRSKNKGDSWDVLYTWDEDGTKGSLVTRFGAHGNGMGRGNGEALAIDPNNSNNMFYGSRNKGLWKSTDNGTSWEHVDAWTSAAGSDTTWNGSGFSFVQYAPGSSDVLYAGFLREGTTSNSTFENVFTSTDGGTTWKALPIPTSLRETAGGATVRLMPQRAVIANDGSFVVITFGDGAGPHSMGWDEGWGAIWDGFGRGAVLKYDVATATWSDVSPEDFIDDGATGTSDYDNADYSDTDNYQYIAPYGGIAINPSDPLEMIVTTEGYRGPQFWYTATSDSTGSWSDQWGTNIYRTTDGGETWVASFKYYWMEGGYYPTTQQMDDNGIGWMHNGSIHWSGSVAIDPFNTERVFVTSGNGVFRCDNISDYTVIAAGTYDEETNYYYSSDEAIQGQVWKVSSHGIEETVPYEVVSIPGGPLISVIADYDGFRHDDVTEYPSSRHITSGPGFDVSLGSTYSLAYAPKKGTLVKSAATRVYEGEYNDIDIELIQLSNDSGSTWTVSGYNVVNSAASEGTVAISTDGSVVIWVPGTGTSNVYRYESSNWTTVSGIDTSVYVVGDPEKEDVFYAYDNNTGKFYQSTDKGSSFTAVSTPGVSEFEKIRAIPGYEGDIWIPVGIKDENGNPKSGALMHSTDGGVTWVNATGVTYCEAVGYGISSTGEGYPAIYAYATVDGTTGVYGSDDQGATWTRINDDGHEYGGLANGEFVMGDMNTYGVVYMSTAGRGVAARVPSTWNATSSSAEGTTSVAPQITPSTASVTYSQGNLELNLNASVARVNVYNMQGQKLFAQYYSSSTSIPVKSLVKAKGSYIVRVDNGKQVLFFKRVILTR